MNFFGQRLGAEIAPDIDLELDENEEVLYLARRHWVVLLQRGAALLVLLVLALVLLSYRAIGGTFIVDDVGQSGQLDIPNILLLILIGVLLFLWWTPRQRNPKKPPLGLPYLLAIGVLGLAFFYRLQGGRLLYIDPLNAVGLDTLNLVLLVFSLALIAFLVYVTIDWANDYLILTNTRVVYEDRQEIPFLGIVLRHVQQQMLIDDIQQVNVRADRYLEYWLGFGTITVRSFSPRRLTFANAADPEIMQKRVLAEVNALRREQAPEVLRQMIEEQVYGQKPLKPSNKHKSAIKLNHEHGIFVQSRPSRDASYSSRLFYFLLGWLFEPNPQINYETETLIWRPSWLYTLLQMSRPLISLLLVTVALILLGRFGIITGGWPFVVWVVIAVGCLLWALWIREEIINDVYILTRQDITDVDKRPFGPESRRRAPLNAIQDTAFHVTFLESLIGYGDVSIETGGAGGGKFTFYNVPHPRSVQATINDYLTDFRRYEKERQMRDAVTLIREYHAVQGSHGELLNKDRLVQDVMERMATQIASPEPAQDQDTAVLTHELRREARSAARREVWQTFRRLARRRSRGQA